MVKKIIKKIFKYDSCFCPCCNAHFKKFLPLPKDYVQEVKDRGFIFKIESSETLNIDQYLCPKCDSTDRDRLLSLCLVNCSKSKRIKNILHVAPARSISNFIKRETDVREVTVDLYMSGVDYNLSLTDLSEFSDHSFDSIICSHVLEHIEDHEKAVSELFRVAKNDSICLFLVPINKSLNSNLEIPNINNVSDRWKYYGQDDHVRLYSRAGFIKLLSNAGFDVEMIHAKNIPTIQRKSKKFGIDKDSVVYIARKK